MRPELQVILSGCLTFGVPLVLALREIVMLRRGGSGWRPGPAPDAQPKPLPPCLLVTLPPRPPVAAPPKTRVPELV